MERVSWRGRGFDLRRIKDNCVISGYSLALAWPVVCVTLVGVSNLSRNTVNSLCYYARSLINYCC